MRLRLDATPEEFLEKSEALLERLADEVRPYSPELASRLEKALPPSPVELRSPVLRHMQEQMRAAYVAQLQAMVADIQKLLSEGAE